MKDVKIGTLLRYMSLFLSRFAERDIEKHKRESLEKFATEARTRTAICLGYPVNQNVRLRGFYEWYVSSGLDRVSMNNCGIPEEYHIFNTHDFEREVIEFFAPYFGFKKKEAWGFVTTGGTDGNNHGIYFGRNVLQTQTGKLPVVYVSSSAHYSLSRLAHIQNLELKIIKSDDQGRMIPSEFEKALNPKKPALVIYAIGTTFKGGIDDQHTLNAIIEKKKPIAVYRHLDGALFGGYLPFCEYRTIIDRQKEPYDSIAVSAHKFFGMDEPSGFMITTKEVLKYQTGSKVPYLNSTMPLISCSRSPLTPLKFWWIIQTMQYDGFAKQTKDMLENARYLKAKLDELKWPAWLEDCSNTVYFKAPAKSIFEKYDLAPDFDPSFGGDLAHVVVMQHVTRPVVDQFVADLAETIKKKS